ncbi:hypothetical protein [Phyllobacterium sp. YR531]|uniref:hypothetical protein n=1 Tax=Phyllobacterium sp. YR531 TaxID=1144343 RepID=UPI00026FBAFB|nr:hypothetical protein [Phyllobacterium sp. YR531]EJN04287.1 hypothetical protein PMI41_01926 [Phyllobacterium sp. YR531]
MTDITPATDEQKTATDSINWPWVLRARADASYLGDTEGTVKLLRQVADVIDTTLAHQPVTAGWNEAIDFVLKGLEARQFTFVRDVLDYVRSLKSEGRK